MALHTVIQCICLAVFTHGSAGIQEDDATRPPNVVIIVSDDAGYADFSLNGSTHFPTPHIDSIAKNGVQFAQGYVSASVCSPSRAGLLTGRYQQRFGHHLNIPPKYSEANGLPVEESTLADARLRLRDTEPLRLASGTLGTRRTFILSHEVLTSTTAFFKEREATSH